jgi:hypothetical protein
MCKLLLTFLSKSVAKNTDDKTNEIAIGMALRLLSMGTRDALVVAVFLVSTKLSFSEKISFDLLGNHVRNQEDFAAALNIAKYSAITTRSAAAILPNLLPILFVIDNGVKSFAAAKKLTVPPIYDPQRQPARIADVLVAVDVEYDEGIGTKKNEAMHPNMEPKLPIAKGINMPIKHCFVML